MILSEEAMLRELEYLSNRHTDIVEFLQEADSLVVNEEYDKVVNRLQIDILDVDKFVSLNQCKPVTNARPFTANGVSSNDGLLSNEIFGYTQKERSGTFGYIDLHGWFLDPSCYKTWCTLDSRIKNIVFGVSYYSIDEKGNLYDDEESGHTGIDWLRKNISKIKFKESESNMRKISIKYLERNRDRMFINKYIVIPPLYRDKNTGTGSRVVVGLGGVNKIYTNLIVASEALTSTQEYGFDASDSMKGRVQDIILQLYDFFSGNNNASLENSKGSGLSSKLGLFRRTAMSKTADFSSRLVISPIDLKVNKPEDLMIDFDKSAVPLYSAMTQFRDFVMFQVRQFFENEFTGAASYPAIDKNGKVKSIVPEDPEIIFGDERIEKEMDRFLHGYNNRFVPVEVPVAGTKEKYYMQYKGRNVYPGEGDPSNPLTQRRLTWCDIFYIATVEAVRDKHVLITRFPIDYFSNQFTTKVEVASTRETEVVEYDGTIYKWYPKIREQDIGTDTSNVFVDTLRFSNLYLSGIGGDFDGDQCTIKGVYTREANEELDKFMSSKQNLVTYGCKPLREPGSDSIQAIYALTKILSDVKVTDSKAIEFK